MGILKFGLATALLSLGLYTCAFRDYPTANAATASVTYTFSSGQKIVASQINQNYNDILGAINGNLNSDNLLDGGVATADLASSAVTTAKIADSNVTTAKIADSGVTQIKLGAANYTLATGSGVAASFAATGSVTLFTPVITKVSRPIVVSIEPAPYSVGSRANLQRVAGGAGSTAEFFLEVNGATKTSVLVGGGSSADTLIVPCSGLLHYTDVEGSAGDRVYTLKALALGADNWTMRDCRLVVREL